MRLAYDREVDDAPTRRLLDHPRTDWAFSIARRYLYDEADAVRLEALAESTFTPLAELVAKIRREEVYHRLHASAWLRRLADDDGEAARTTRVAWRPCCPTPRPSSRRSPGEQRLVAAGVIAATNGVLEARWRQAIGGTCRELGLAGARPGGRSGATAGRPTARPSRWLWGEATMVRRLDPEATW